MYVCYVFPNNIRGSPSKKKLFIYSLNNFFKKYILNMEKGLC